MPRLIDLTYPLSACTPIFPGLPSPSIEPLFSVVQDGASVCRANFATHTGTHIDAPHHAFTGAQPVDELPLVRLIGEAPCV